MKEIRRAVLKHLRLLVGYGAVVHVRSEEHPYDESNDVPLGSPNEGKKTLTYFCGGCVIEIKVKVSK